MKEAMTLTLKLSDVGVPAKIGAKIIQLADKKAKQQLVDQAVDTVNNLRVYICNAQRTIADQQRFIDKYTAQLQAIENGEFVIDNGKVVFDNHELR